MTEDVEPQWTTESIGDLHELLIRASNWADQVPNSGKVPAELRDGAAFVDAELRESRRDDEVMKVEHDAE